MNPKFTVFATKVLRAVSVNVARLLISVLLTLFLPNLLGVEQYSYWQLYQFYLTYALYSSLGMCEGMYLKIGGQKYEELNCTKISGQFFALGLYELVMNITVILVISCSAWGTNEKAVLILAIVCAFFEIMRYFIQTVLQASGEIKTYSHIAFLEQVLFLGLVLAVVFIGSKEFLLLIYAQILARIVALIYAVIKCKRVVISPIGSMKNVLTSSKNAVKLGYKLLLANLAGQLVIGVVRFGIENHFGTIAFGKVSLTLSLVSMVVTTVSAVGLVLFPMLRQFDVNKLEKIYSLLRIFITVPILLLLVFYLPIKTLLEMWLPEYLDSIKYLAILLPICLFETRSTVISATYFKVFTQVGKILFVNIISVLLSVILTCISVYLMGSLDIAVLFIVVLSALKNILSEILLSQKLKCKILSDIALEQILVWGFVLFNMNFSPMFANLFYVMSFLVYIFIKRVKIFKALNQVKNYAFKA